MKIKTLIKSISLTLAMGLSLPALSEPISRSNFVSGTGVLLVEDTDLFWLVIDNKTDFDAIMDGVNWRHGAVPEQAIHVKLASVNPLTQRHSAKMDSIASNTFRAAMEFNEKEVSYICFGIESTKEFKKIPFCSFLQGENDIAFKMLEIGGAEYDLNQYHPWQHNAYIKSENLGRDRRIGIWSPMYGIFHDKTKAKDFTQVNFNN